MADSPLNVGQEDECCNLDLHPILVWLGGENLVLEHVENLGLERLEDEVDGDGVDLKVEDRRDWDAIIVWRVPLEARFKAECFLSAKAP